jgi:organic hydroperoxide reductase OsmC/OhrA
MLFFLWHAAREGWVIASYVDQAVGIMSKGADGRQWISRVTLAPQVTFEGDQRPSVDQVEALHRASHEACFIANSVKTEVVVEGSSIGLRQGEEITPAQQQASPAIP